METRFAPPTGTLLAMRRAATFAAAAALVLTACQSSASPAPTTGNPAATQPGATAPAATSSGATGVPPASAPPSSPGASAAAGQVVVTTQTYEVTAGAHPHDVAVASDGGIWYTGQRNETLGWLDPASGEVTEVRLPNGAAPHGVITGPDGAAWVTDQGLDAILRVEGPADEDVEVFRAPAGTSPHTAVFDLDGILWFTGAAGWIGRLDPAAGQVERFRAPRGAGPYGITVTPSNEVWFVSLQQSYLGKVDKATGEIEAIEPRTPGAGTRRVWSDSEGHLWVSYWNAGMVAAYDPETQAWKEWDLPGNPNQGYSMYVDELDGVWISDFGQNSVVRFHVASETFQSFQADRPNASVRQMLGRPGEAWGAESGLDRLIVFRYGPG